MDKIVISGVGMLSSIGIDIDSHVQVMKEGKADFLETEESFGKRVRKAKDVNVRKFVKNKKSVRFFSKQTIIGCYCAKMAKDDAKISDDDIAENERRNALILGSGYSQSLLPMADALVECIEEDGKVNYDKVGNEGYRQLSPLWILSRLPNTTAGQISIENGIKGFNYTVVNGVNSGIVAVGEAFLSIMQDRADRVFCGGIEDEVLPDFIYELQKDHLLAENNQDNKVFGEKSTGSSIGEGGCVFILEKESKAKDRNAELYGEVVGYSNLYIPELSQMKDANKISVHMQKNMKKAMQMAKVDKSDIDFVQASAGGNPLLDMSEAIAISNIFGDSVYVTEAKSFIGDTLAASGAFSVAFACLQMKYNFIAPNPDGAKCVLEDKLSYVKEKAVYKESEFCLVNSFSHLGEMCSLVVKKR